MSHYIWLYFRYIKKIPYSSLATMARTKRPPQRIFERASHSVSIDQANSIYSDPHRVLTDDANINPYMNNQSADSLNFDTHILRSNSNHSSNGKHTQMNDRLKMFSNNPRTIANHRAKEKQKGVKLLCDKYTNQFRVYKSWQLRTLWASKNYKAMSNEEHMETEINLIDKLDSIWRLFWYN